MSLSSYQQRNAASEAPQSLELRAFGFVTQQLINATTPADRAAALHKNHQLWQTLLTDLAHEDNQLPPQIKAGLISLGLWSTKYCLRAMFEGLSLEPLIDVNSQIAGGLTDQMRKSMAPAATAAAVAPAALKSVLGAAI